ncbi:MAG: CotH kinase family protein [Flavobacteriales bacterium]|nr:CotH kinase family protein [Flavobacteriales bacterium]
MKALWYVTIGVATCTLISSVVRAPAPVVVEGQKGIVQQRTMPRFTVADDGEVEMQLPEQVPFLYTMGATKEWRDFPLDGRISIGRADKRHTEHLVSLPTSISWLHPDLGQPSAIVVRVAEKFDANRIGTPYMATKVIEDHQGLPVISLLVAEGAFFDPDTGIYVSGNAIIHPTPEMVTTHLEDGRWWKYPGNYHFRGKEWQRSGTVQLIDGNGAEVFQSPVGIRINGQMTRGFPIHALRLLFDAPINSALFEDGDGSGSTILLLRSAGNDQMKAMMRDALAHELCKGEPFEVSRSLACAVYVNGAYWGLHELRQRVEEEEVARRYGVSDKDLAMLEIRSNHVLGKKKQVALFESDLSDVLAMDPASNDFVATVSERFDVDGFLSYMASVMILDNKDWPDANIKFWRYTGKHTMKAPLDGRWYFILTDMDLSLGAYGEPEAPLLDRIKGRSSPMPKLFYACMGSPELRQTFISKVEELINGRFAANRTIETLDRFVSGMEPEMPRHIARWRRPLNMDTWHMEVDRIRTYLRARPEQIRLQIPGLFK